MANWVDVSAPLVKEWAFVAAQLAEVRYLGSRNPDFAKPPSGPYDLGVLWSVTYTQWFVLLVPQSGALGRSLGPKIVVKNTYSPQLRCYRQRSTLIEVLAW